MASNTTKAIVRSGGLAGFMILTALNLILAVPFERLARRGGIKAPTTAFAVEIASYLAAYALFALVVSGAIAIAVAIGAPASARRISMRSALLAVSAGHYALFIPSVLSTAALLADRAQCKNLGGDALRTCALSAYGHLGGFVPAQLSGFGIAVVIVVAVVKKEAMMTWPLTSALTVLPIVAAWGTLELIATMMR